MNGEDLDGLFAKVGMADGLSLEPMPTADDDLVFVVHFGVATEEHDRFIFSTHEALCPVGSAEAIFIQLVTALDGIEVFFFQV